ncbi:hypothetical protein [Streptomyces sp. PTY087I2]|uniref:hypothetical protein n=1 Tax=Streptomyces sp. PTY087I2 TaxID=1819298 RepID=UPI0008283DA6|nr:hypothetical protein [Streptomyces sp. PTY087I2]OCC13954.1 hypothetical protein A3Q37_00226 [Streptomyces sp. PTY087I2]
MTVAKQISELGKRITALGDEILFRTASPDLDDHTTRVVRGFAVAVEPAGEVASALGSVAHQLSFLERTEHLRDQPDAMDAREAATLVIGDALGLADASLRDASYSLYAAAAAASPPSRQLRAARSRSTTAAPLPAAAPSTVPPAAAASSRTARGR